MSRSGWTGEDEDTIRKAVTSVYEPLRERLAQLEDDVDTQIAQNRRTALAPAAFRALAPSLQAILATAANHVHPDLGATPEGFLNAADGVLGYLFNAFDTTTAVHLNEVNKATDTHHQALKSKPARAPDEAVRALANMDLLDAKKAS
ncbi:hypothetical protein [Hydrogenophaga sp.]|uniref:hypothetical protein n=1 Tax=Hydrogenophaga sp. TaxID=1904254 RepID=UPI0027246159|nr:hypothetical protein [Hydrogenophaga sp.]MDO9437165.1 hypothetical protein [Hydrogenophaga sp.]